MYPNQTLQMDQGPSFCDTSFPSMKSFSIVQLLTTMALAALADLLDDDRRATSQHRQTDHQTVLTLCIHDATFNSLTAFYFSSTWSLHHGCDRTAVDPNMPRMRVREAFQVNKPIHIECSIDSMWCGKQCRCRHNADAGRSASKCA